jgi:tetratricopeptide (TPR) repeat protein
MLPKLSSAASGSERTALNASPSKMNSKSAFLKSLSSKATSKARNTAKQSEAFALEELLRNENDVQRHRREAVEAKAREKRLNDAKALFESRKEIALHEKELRYQRRKLVHKVHVRPGDKSSALKLIDVAYELGDYFQVCTVIKRSLLKFPELRVHSVYLKLGRCFLRRWKTDGSRNDLNEAYDAYRKALNDPNVLMRPLANPYAYFEFIGICARLDKCQMAMDALGAIMARFEDNYDLLMLCQYIVAQLSLVNGQFDAAYKTYQQVMLCPQVIEPLLIFPKEEKIDSIPMVSSFITSILCQVEVACLQHMSGNKKMSVRMLSEAFDRQNKLGPTILSDSSIIDIRNNETNFEQWASSYHTYKFLGDLFQKKLFNLAIAAQLYGIAGEVYSNISLNINILSKEKKTELCSLILDRGECLAEMGAHDDAEHCGHYAFKVLPVDPVVTGRAARCCQRINEKNEHITILALNVFKAVNLMSRVLRKKVAARRKEAKQALNDYATIINSAIRMALVRNRMAGDFLEITPAGRIGNRIHNFRNLWKSGKEELDFWVEFWNVSCNIIQRGLWRWYIRRQQTRVVRGITSCKRIWRGQHLRWKLRNQISQIQLDLDEGIQCGKGQHGLYFDSFLVQRLNAGITVVTNDQNEFIMSPSVNQKLSKLSLKLSENESNSIDEYSLRSKDRSFRGYTNGNIDDAGVSLFRNASNSLNSPNNNNNSNNNNGSYIKSNSAPSSLEKTTLPTISIAGSSQIQSTLFGTKSSALINVEDLDTYVQVAHKTGEDVISMISNKSVSDDNAYLWVPFASLPEEAVVRLLTCTILVITSPSFTIQDSMRMVYICKKYSHLWSNVKSLLIYGTQLAKHGSGIQNLLDLGITDLVSLSIGYTGISSSFGSFLGKMLMDKEKNMKPCSLTKLYIENENRFGINGTNDLCKSLQFNSSLRILSIRRCGLDHHVVTSLARFVSLSTNLEILNVNDNHFTYSDCRQLLHAVANKGIKGNFRGLYCIGTKPSLKLVDLQKLLKEGISINVNVISGELDNGGVGFLKELMLEKEMEMVGDNIEHRKMDTIHSFATEMKRLGTIENWEKVALEGVKAYKAIYF